MKKMKFAVLLAALATVFGFSSCLDSDDNSNYPDYQVYATVTGDEIMGFRLYADNGSILIPTSQSVAQLPGLKNVERALVAFTLTEDMTPGQELKPNQTYTVVLNPTYCTGLPTSRVINTYNNAAADTLFKNADPIISLQEMYATKGYATVAMTVPFNGAQRFYMNVGYDSQVDVDAENNTLKLHVYYDQNSNNAYQQGQGIFCFRLPEIEYGKFEADSIKLLLNAKTTQSGTDGETKEFKISRNDLIAPRY